MRSNKSHQMVCWVSPLTRPWTWIEPNRPHGLTYPNLTSYEKSWCGGGIARPCQFFATMEGSELTFCDDVPVWPQNVMSDKIDHHCRKQLETSRDTVDCQAPAGILFLARKKDWWSNEGPHCSWRPARIDWLICLSELYSCRNICPAGGGCRISNWPIFEKLAPVSHQLPSRLWAWTGQGDTDICPRIS